MRTLEAKTWWHDSSQGMEMRTGVAEEVAWIVSGQAQKKALSLFVAFIAYAKGLQGRCTMLVK